MKKQLLIFLAILSCSLGYAQNRKTVNGTVKDAQGQPLPGVSIIEVNGKNGVSTSPDGTYEIRVGTDATLRFSFIGFKTQEVPVGNRTTINLTMAENGQALKEITITTALGINKADKNLGYSATTVKGEDITRTNTDNPITGLQGKVEGVKINVMSAAGIKT